MTPANSIAWLACGLILYGSLALTGMGHGTDRAILLGLAGNEPAAIDPASIESTVAAIRAARSIESRRQTRQSHSTNQATWSSIATRCFLPARSTQHPNGCVSLPSMPMASVLAERTFFSIGGGFIAEDGAADRPAGEPADHVFRIHFTAPPNFLTSPARTLSPSTASCWQTSASACAPSIRAATSESLEMRVRAGIEKIWQAMQACAERGMAAEGILPGGLQVRRRARRLAERLRAREAERPARRSAGSSRLGHGLRHGRQRRERRRRPRGHRAHQRSCRRRSPLWRTTIADSFAESDDEGIVRFFLTSAAIGVLYKENASISGAEVGCQGEVGVACSMAAAGLTSALGGNDGQIEHAAEIAMEHNLGMTCDPIGGLVQIPCIERNAMGAAKAVQAARLALNEPAAHKVSLDQVIRTMYLTGLDMQSRYKETSLAGLALNVIEC